MKTLLGIGLICVVATTSGCASIVNGTNQSLSVETKSKSANLSGATCKLVNDKGVWFVTTPGSVTVHRAYGDLAVTCEKDGVEPGLVSVKSSTKGMLAGNILFGGAIGAAVDMANGSAYDYPDLITVVMGESNVIAPPAPKPEEQNNPDEPGNAEPQQPSAAAKPQELGTEEAPVVASTQPTNDEASVSSNSQ